MNEIPEALTFYRVAMKKFVKAQLKVTINAQTVNVTRSLDIY
jgi:hypothetical protein